MLDELDVEVGVLRLDPERLGVGVVVVEFGVFSADLDLLLFGVVVVVDVAFFPFLAVDGVAFPFFL